MDKFNIADYFVSVLDQYVSKSKKNKFSHIIENTDHNKEDILFITDKIGDMKEAQEHNIPTILVSWGYQKKKHLETHAQNVLAIIDTPKELTQYVSNLLN